MTAQQLYDLFQQKLVIADLATASVKDKADFEQFSLPFVEKALVIWDKASLLRTRQHSDAPRVSALGFCLLGRSKK